MQYKEMLKDLTANKRSWALPLLAVTWNQSVYYVGRFLTKNRLHYEFSTWIDEKIPLVSWTVFIYFICFFVWAIVYIYMASRDKQTAYRFFLADFIGKTICLCFFLALPTTMERPTITGTGIWDILMKYLYLLDSADNLFPSIHCMVSWYCWIGFRKQKECPAWCRYAMLVFAVAVCISTVTTRQHVVVDIFGGILFAELSYGIAKWLIQKYLKRRM